MAVPSRECQVSGVNEVMISFERPPSMSDAEMRAWIAERAHSSEPALMLAGPESASAELLCVELPTSSIEAARAQLAELMMDMRLLGLRPEVVRTRA
jgi:hypothetical protein